MADDAVEQVRAYIQEILRLVHGMKGRTLRELNELVGQTGKLELHSITNVYAKVIMVENYLFETCQEEEAPLPISVEFKHLRRSARLPRKRTYENMQVPNTRTGRLVKRSRLAANGSFTNILPINGPSREPATDGPTNKIPNEAPEAASESSTTASATGISTRSEPIIDKSSMPCLNIAEASKFFGTDNLPASAIHIQIEGGGITSASPADDMFPMTHDDGFAILSEFFEKPAIESGPKRDVEGLGKMPGFTAESTHRVLEHTIRSNTLEALNAPQHSLNTVSTKALDMLDSDLPIASAAMSDSGSSGSSEPRSLSTDLTSHAPSETYINSDSPSGVQDTAYVNRLILDDAAPWLEHVLLAIETGDTSRRPNSLVPGVLDDVITKDDFILCLKIMTSITENWVKCNRSIATAAINAAQERSQEIKQNMIVPCVGRLASEYVSQLPTQKGCLVETVPLDIRDLAEMEMQKLLSEPKELTSEFREESDYETAIRQIRKENANDARIRLRHSWKETYYWPMIQQRAKMIGPLPNPSGRKTEITPQEKSAAKKLIHAMGYGQSRDNIFKWTAYWKLLSELRDKGATPLLLYRTSEFKAYFFQHPKELDMLLSWNRVYDFPLRQLGARTLAEEGNDFSGKSDIEEKWIFDRLHAPQNLCWGDHLSMWDYDSLEPETFRANHKIKPTSRKSNIHVLQHGLKGQPDRNKSRFINLVPYEGKSSKRTLGSRSASVKLLAVAPLVPIFPGDFLGIFAGRLRYTDQKPPRSIPGPVPNLWLDYSVAMGKLSRIRVAKADEMTNVCLAWEAVNEVKGENSSCQYLRILVIATRHIMPFDQLVRPPVVRNIS